MISDYRKVYSEVVSFLNYLPKEEYIKIPYDLIEYFKWRMDYSYKFEYNPEISLEEQNISDDAKAIIIKIYNDYFATDDQKNKIKNILK